MADLNGINYANDRRINRAVLATESHARGASLNNQHKLINARAHGVNHDNMALLILAVHVDQPRDEELASKQAIIFARSDYGSNYSCKKHNSGHRLEVTGDRPETSGFLTVPCHL
jgi:hypothetical protein